MTRPMPPSQLTATASPVLPVPASPTFAPPAGQLKRKNKLVDVEHVRAEDRKRQARRRAKSRNKKPLFTFNPNTAMMIDVLVECARLSERDASSNPARVQDELKKAQAAIEEGITTSMRGWLKK
jgi:hypothetical protein